MSDPSNPNYKAGVGRLVTDRFDFQKHIDGYITLRHKAGAITVSPAVTVPGYGAQTDVQSALEKLALVVSPPDVIVNDATLFAKGIVQLAGDIGGTATNVKVTKIQGFSVLSTPPTSNQVLMWNGVAWAPSTPTSTFIAAGDLGGTNTSQTVVGIRGRAMAATAPSTNQVIAWNGSTWTPTTIMPTGTGFATTTGGVFDTAATANIRYAGGKFQTDVNIQWKNGSTSTGDLQWSLGSSNRVLQLPDTSDVLVARTYAQTILNKTISVTDNVLTATGITTGDILVASGGSFTRMAKGSNGSFLGVQSGNVGFYTPSTSTPAGTGFATVTSSVYDANATANIRYTGAGKFQTDSPIQYNAAGVTLDLTWSASSTNRTLFLPDASDTLVGRNTGDTLNNKNINVSNNTITATSIATGDILKSSGSSFTRFARGSALQVLRVNSGGTDLEWATISAGGTSAGSANAVQLSDGAGGFLANATLGLQSGGALRVNITNTNVEYQVPVAGYATGSIPFRMQFATVNATTGSGAYTLSPTELASPILVFSNTSSDGYIIIPNTSPAGTIYFIKNNASGDIKFTRPADYGINTALFSLNPGQSAILISNGSTYTRINNLF